MRVSESMLKRLTSEMSELAGAQVRVIDARGVFHVSIENEVQMRIRANGRQLSYVEASTSARQLRAEAPVLIWMAHEGGVRVHVDLLPDQVAVFPDRVRICTVALAGRTMPEDDLPPLAEVETVAVIETVDGVLTYDFVGPIGLEDLTSAVQDALMLSEPVEGISCEGAHGVPHSGPMTYAAEVGTAERVLGLRHRLCSDCLHTLAYTGFPLAPQTPQEW